MNRKMMACVVVIAALLVALPPICSCGNDATATRNDKMVKRDSQGVSSSAVSESSGKSTTIVEPKKIVKESSTYECDFAKDREEFAGKVDIKVGDDYYAAQINDWYMYYNDYVGQVVEIEGYYISDFLPYTFVGRKGPTCPCCQGGYVCFEFLWDKEMKKMRSGKDWIKVTGIIREGEDAKQGSFTYIEALKVEKMSKPGKGTVVN